MSEALRLAGAALATVALLGCTALQSMQASMRDPGEKNLDLPEPVVEEYHCKKRPLPFAEVEEYEVLPARVKPGKHIAHRVVYVMCPARRTQVVPGRLTTRILFKGDVIVADGEDYELKPGRWRKDQSIDLPTTAEPGVYSLDVEFRAAGSKAEPSFLEQASFIVLPPE